MKTFVVIESFDANEYILGIYDSEEKAKERIVKHHQRCYDKKVSSFEEIQKIPDEWRESIYKIETYHLNNDLTIRCHDISLK